MNQFGHDIAQLSPPFGQNVQLHLNNKVFICTDVEPTGTNHAFVCIVFSEHHDFARFDFNKHNGFV